MLGMINFLKLASNF